MDKTSQVFIGRYKIDSEAFDKLNKEYGINISGAWKSDNTIDKQRPFIAECRHVLEKQKVHSSKHGRGSRLIKKDRKRKKSNK